MMKRLSIRHTVAVLTVAAGIALSAAATAAEGDVTFSPDPAVASQQRPVYDVVHRYEQMLNAGNTAEIMKLYAPDSVSEWNDKPTFKTLQQKVDGYDALFKIATFTTVFSYDSIDVYGDTAIIRTHHHKGATAVENGKTVLDLNREVFVLRKMAGVWKIVFYMFNTNPNQGEG